MKSEKLTKLIGVRVSEAFYHQLEDKRKKTNCQSLCEFVRAILYKEKITFYYTDATVNATAVELAGIRKELNHIGNNINQITKSFHAADSDAVRIAQHIMKGFSMFIYDFKYDDLSRIAYNALRRHPDNYKTKPAFYVINSSGSITGAIRWTLR